MIRYDLHCHSAISDGTDTPKELVRRAFRVGLGLLALTDHDTMAGVPDAVAEGARLHMTVLPSVELDNEWPHELHILGLDVKEDDPGLTKALAFAHTRRNLRNREILRKLALAGYDVAAFMPEKDESVASVSRLHIALALCKAGFAKDVPDAFARLLAVGKPGYAKEARLSPDESIAIIRGAGGVPVLAHPCHIRNDPHGTVRTLCEMGLGGIEAYYPTSTQGQTELFVSLARQYRLMITCGSDYHGGNRAGAPLGCAWRDIPCLAETADFFFARHTVAHGG